jgi:hypothetical protein
VQPIYTGHAKAALNSLYSSNPAARAVGTKANAILIFPQIVKGGSLVGARHGDGALLVNGKTGGYYNTVAASQRISPRAELHPTHIFDFDLRAVCIRPSSHTGAKMPQGQC